MLNKLKIWYRYNGKYTLRNVRTGALNLYSWFWVIWNDRDYDYSYILKLLRFKLRKTRKAMLKNNRFVGVEHTVRYIKIAEELLKRISEGYYELEPYDYKKTKFIWHEIEGSDSYELETKIVEDNLDQYFAKYPKLYKKYSRTETNRTQIHVDMSRELHTKAKRLLFKIIEEKIEEWWD